MSWPKAKLSEVAPAKPLRKIGRIDEDHVLQITLDHIESDSGRLLKRNYAPVSEAGSSTHWFDNRYVLYSKLRPYLNKVYLPDELGLGTTELVPMLPNDQVLDRKYLGYFLRSKTFVDWVSSQTAGAKMPRVSMKVFWDYEIPLPPLAEQKRIAAILDKADAIRRKRQQAIQLADEFLRAVFLDMFGDPVTNPKGWEVVNSGDLYLAPPRIGTTTPAKGEGNLVVRVGELGQFNIAFERCGRVQLSTVDFDKFVLVPGDTVLARAIGSKNQLGKASYYSGHTESVVIDSHVMRLRPNREICNPEWFYRFVSSDGGKSLLQTAGGATAVQFNINAKQASKLKIPLPPLALQNKFIELCSSYLNASNDCIAHERMTFELFNSLSQKAFSGEL